MTGPELQFVCCYTLIDITSTGVIKKRSTDQRQRNQQSNYETFTQLISLRTQPLELTSSTKLENQKLSDYEFGIKSNKRHTVWSLIFATEFIGVFDKDNQPLAALREDFDQVPIICGLDETYVFKDPKIITNSLNLNTYFVYSK